MTPDFKNTIRKRLQTNWVPGSTVLPRVLTSTSSLNGFWVEWARGGSSLHGPCLCLATGFWKSKFDPSLTQRDFFHLDEQFTVPVDMMQAHSYPLRWFLLEQPEIQVTLGCPADLGAGRWEGREGCGVKGVSHLPCSPDPGQAVLKGSTVPLHRGTEIPGFLRLIHSRKIY
jgi:hypothetical protein